MVLPGPTGTYGSAESALAIVLLAVIAEGAVSPLFFFLLYKPRETSLFSFLLPRVQVWITTNLILSETTETKDFFGLSTDPKQQDSIFER